MKSLFEYIDKLNGPYECFIYDNIAHHFPVKPHWHYFMEIIYMIDGTVISNVKNVNYTINTGDLMLFPPSSVHSIHAVSDEPFSYFVLKFDPYKLSANINPSFLNTWNFSAVFTDTIPNENATIYFASKDLDSLSAYSLFKSCVDEMRHKKYGYQMIIESKIRELLTYILRIWRENGFDTDQLFTPLYENDSLYTITQYIDKHAHEDLHVHDLAKRCNMSYSYFAKNFRELYGQSCKKYIEFIKLCKVEDMLLFTNFDLTYISQEAGFSDCSHLIKTFKAKHNITPHQYRLSKGSGFNKEHGIGE